jgi:hypothetical protein
MLLYTEWGNNDEGGKICMIVAKEKINGYSIIFSVAFKYSRDDNLIL